MKKNILLIVSFLSLSDAVAAPNPQQGYLSKVRSFTRSAGSRVLKNKGTYAFFGAHALMAAALVQSPLDGRLKAVLTALYGLGWGAAFEGSFLLGRRFEEEVEAREQAKILNTSDWTKKNGIIINGMVYRTGFELWKAYETSSDRKAFLRQFLSVVANDSSATNTRQVISAAIEDIKEELAQCTNHSHERYTNAGLLLGRHFYQIHVHKGRALPFNIERWLWEEDRGGDLFRAPMGEAYFEEYLNPGFLADLGVYETDFFARLFSLTETQKRVRGFIIPWYQVSSYSRNGAAHYYVALLKHYVFLLSCRALCDQIIATEVVQARKEVFY